MRHTTLLAGAAALVMATSALAAPPQHTLERFEEALQFFDGGDHGTTYTARSHVVVSKPNGNDREEQIRVSEVAVSVDGERTTTTLQVIQDGVDVTDDEEAQSEFGQASDEETAEAEGEAEGGGFNLSLSLPFGEDAAAYTIGDAVLEGGLMVAEFGPAPGHDKDAGISIGKLAWHADSGEPAWVRFTFARNPRFVKSMASVLEFTVDGARIYPSRSFTAGVGGFLLYKRKMELDVTIEDVRSTP
jgi:hypothetical protein